jgi:hypothetical protein
LKLIIFILGLTILSSFAAAETLEVEYSSFYSHVKKLDDPETNVLRFAFGFQHITEERLCHISSAKIVTQKQTLELTVEDNERFTVPTDKILKMAKAQVVLELDDQANRCDMSVQLETLPSYLKTQYSHDELLLLFEQYQAFFDEMGGFLSFMMPSAEGLLFHFEEGATLPESLQPLMNKEGTIALNKIWLAQGNGLELPHKPLRITTIVEK